MQSLPIPGRSSALVAPVAEGVEGVVKAVDAEPFAVAAEPEPSVAGAVVSSGVVAAAVVRLPGPVSARPPPSSAPHAVTATTPALTSAAAYQLVFLPVLVVFVLVVFVLVAFILVAFI
ncbi:hypothetical protein [Streptomyces sp. NPDC088785]|uniref:hypothetical protein n=1 Tax=Streptomyces sp. NPDC088785 TaxID=3365897 RepID=UPI003828DC12